MTEYEVVSALTATLDLLWTIFATYVSIVFAFLVASYLVAHKLVSGIVWLVLTLYTVVSAWAIFGLSRTSATVVGLVFEIKRMALEPGSTLGWHTVVSTPDIAFPFISFVTTSVGVIAYVGSIVFFFYQRHLNVEASKQESI